MTKVLDNVLEAIGNTKIVNCSRLVEHWGFPERSLPNWNTLTPASAKRIGWASI